MQNNTLSSLRDADFATQLVAIADDFRRNSIPLSRERLIDLALMQRPKNFYLSFAYVYRRLVSLRRTGFFDTPHADLKPLRMIWTEINAKVNAYLYRNTRASLTDAISHVLNFSRPDRFYISRAKADEIFGYTFTYSKSWQAV